MTAAGRLAATSWPVRIAIALGVLLVASVAFLWFKLQDANAAQAKAALAEANAVAYADSTRELKKVITAQGDTLRTFSRLVIQQQQQQDDIDRVIGQTRISLARVEARLKTLNVHDIAGTPTTETASGARSGSFDYREIPFTVHGVVTLPRPPGLLILDTLRISVDTIPLAVRQSCAEPNEHGIRYATVSVSGPSWAPVAVRQAEQDPGLCRSPAIENQNARDALAHDRRARISLQVGAGAGVPVAPLVPATSFSIRPAWLVYAGVGISKPIPLPSWLSWIPGS